MKKVVFITPPDASSGFSLTGVMQIVTTADGLHDAVRSLANDPVVGLLVIDERLVDARVQDMLRDMERRWPGLIVVLPAPERAARPEEDYALRLIRRAVGYQVRINL